MVVQAYSDGDKNKDGYFLPAERLPEATKRKMAGYLINEVKELKKKTEGKRMRMDKHDDLLKMVYSILSVCKDLSNPNTIINKLITFGIDIEFVPYKEENAAVLQLGWENTDENLKMEEIGESDMKHMSPYRVYLWRSNTMLFVRKKIKIFTIPYQLLQGSIVYAKIERKFQRFGCLFGDNPSQFSRTAEEQACYPNNIQPVNALFDGAKKAQDLDFLDKLVYKQMQRISEACLLDLGIDVNEKDKEGKTLMHYVACLGMGVSGRTTPIDCLVDSGADLSSQDAKGRTPIMAAILKGSTLDKKKETLIHYCEGTPALNIADNDGNNILHMLACKKESKFTKDTIKLLLHSKADAKHTNKDDFNPRDTAKYHNNHGVHEILDNWLSGK